MKRFLVSVFAMFFLAGCTAITTQYNLMNQMGVYTFNSSSNKVYESAVALFKQDKLPLTTIGVNKGVSPWKKAYVSQGSLSHYSEIRYVVEVKPVGRHTSTVRVYKESVPDKKNPVYIGKTLGDEIIKPDRIRYIPYEFRILEKLNPSQAKRMQVKAAK